MNRSERGTSILPFRCFSFDSTAERYFKGQDVRELLKRRSRIFLSRSTAARRELLDRADIPVMPLHALETILGDQHLAAFGFFKMIEHPSKGVSDKCKCHRPGAQVGPSRVARLPRLANMDGTF